LINPISNSEYLLIDEFQKIVYQKQEKDIVRLKQKSLDYYLSSYTTLKDRNRKIISAIEDGYNQSEVARYLGMTSAGVSYIVRNNIQGNKDG
jgi:transcriptional regulator